MSVEIIELQDSSGALVEAKFLEKSEPCHRQLRPDLAKEYSSQMLRVFEGGARMVVSVLEDQVVGVAVYRIYENTATGIHMYVDDLVTDQSFRSRGVGKVLLDALATIAQKQKCRAITLDSATHRQQAYKFYYREGFSIVASHFVKYLEEAKDL